MPAVIESTLWTAPPPGGSVIAGSTDFNSRDDLRLGYHVALRSFHAATTYSWTLSFASDSPGTTVPGTPFDGTSSAAALLAPEGSTSSSAKFNVDYEGTYLIRLTVDAGLPTEDTQFIRCRVLTMFGALKLIAAGERRDEKGVIPVDATPEGWANDQNANMQRIAVLLRRTAESGRVLYVDSNRGRDVSNDQDDYDNLISIPGPEQSRREETGIKMRAMAHGDFSSINEAIAYALAADQRGEPLPSATQPYFIKVNPGLYEEDLNLASHVHIMGTGAPVIPIINATGTFEPSKTGVPLIRTVNGGGTGTHRYNPQGSAATDLCVLQNVCLEATANSTEPVLDVLGGAVSLLNCGIHQQGNAVGQGEALRCVVANPAHFPFVSLYETTVVTDAVAADRVAIRMDADQFHFSLRGSLVGARNCIGVMVNESMYENGTFEMSDHSTISAGVTCYRGYADRQLFNESVMSNQEWGVQALPAIDVSGFGGVKAGQVELGGKFNSIVGNVSLETAAAVGGGILSPDGWRMEGGSRFILPDAPGDVPSVHQTLVSRTVRYEASAPNPIAPGADAVPFNPLPVNSVQEAIDLLVNSVFTVTGSPFYSLNQSYNGLASLGPPPVPGVGLGRRIDALGGAVQITGGTAPFAIDSHLKHGGLQAEGVVDIGGLINGGPGSTLVDVGHSEISLNPNMMGAGPFISLGRATWTNGILGGDRGFGGAVILADRSATGSSYNLHLRTAHGRASGTGKFGNVYMVAGSMTDPAGTDDPGDVIIMAGSTQNAGRPPGDLYLVPGVNAAPDQGVVWFMGSGHFPATLTADNAFVGGQAGTIYIGTPNGVEALSFNGTENLALVITMINTSQTIRAVEAPANFLTLFSEFSPSGDVVYVGDSVGGLLNTAFGDFRASFASFTPAVWGDGIAVDVPQNGRLRVNGDLEVTGAIIGGGGSGFGDYRLVLDVDSPYAVPINEGVLDVRPAGAGVITLSLPVGAVAGTPVLIRHTGDYTRGDARITPAGGDTIMGQASFSLAQGQAVVFFKDGGTDWLQWGHAPLPGSEPYRRLTDLAGGIVVERHSVRNVGVLLVAGVDSNVILDTALPVGREITIKDEDGLANAIPAPLGQKIHITDNGGATFDGAAFLDITTAYGSATMYKNSNGNWSIK